MRVFNEKLLLLLCDFIYVSGYPRRDLLTGTEMKMIKEMNDCEEKLEYRQWATRGPRHCGGGGLFPLVRIFGRMFNHSLPVCAFFLVEVENISRTLPPLFVSGSVRSGSAS